MDLRTLKEKIERKNPINEFIIFECTDNYFVANQYINAISKINNKEIVYLTELPVGILDSNYLFVYEKDTLSECNRSDNNLIIKCMHVKNDSLNSYIVSIPGLESWQIKNYLLAHIKTEEVEFSDTDINTFLAYNQDIFKLNTEMKKILLFNPLDRPRMLKRLLSETVINNTNVYAVADMFITKDYTKFNKSFLTIDGMNLLSVLKYNFNLMYRLKINTNLTASYLKLTDYQYNIIKKNSSKYSLEELEYKYNMINSLFNDIISGIIDKNNIVSYLLIEWR